jgi:hypothetical protein
MQYYGFGSIVGRMWGLGDLSLGFYKEVLSGVAEDGTSPSERSARTLRYMVQNLTATGGTLEQWANWVRYGV